MKVRISEKLVCCSRLSSQDPEGTYSPIGKSAMTGPTSQAARISEVAVIVIAGFVEWLAQGTPARPGSAWPFSAALRRRDCGARKCAVPSCLSPRSRGCRSEVVTWHVSMRRTIYVLAEDQEPELLANGGPSRIVRGSSTQSSANAETRHARTPIRLTRRAVFAKRRSLRHHLASFQLMSAISSAVRSGLYRKMNRDGKENGLQPKAAALNQSVVSGSVA
jgi:hypothetical protein